MSLRRLITAAVLVCMTTLQSWLVAPPALASSADFCFNVHITISYSASAAARNAAQEYWDRYC